METSNSNPIKGRKVVSQAVEPTQLPQPETAREYIQRGMSFYARKRYEESEADFKMAIEADANNEDGFYGLGMVYKARGELEKSTNSFNEVIRLVANSPSEQHNRQEMLRRLALGHINEMQTGDWNLEKEIWRHVN